MSFSTGTRDRPDVLKRNSESLLDTEQLMIQRMKVFNAVSPDGGVVGTGQESGNAADVGAAFMASTNAIVSGATSLTQAAVQLANEQIQVAMIDVDKAWTSFADIANAVTDDILDIIDGGDYSGQILKIKIPDTVTEMTIHNRNKSGNTTSNIFMAGIEDLKAKGGEVIEFIYDTTKTGFQSASASVDGAWRLSSTGGSSAEESFAILGLTADTGGSTTTIVVPFDNNFFFGDSTKIQATATLGVFQLNDGAFNGECILQVEAVDTGGGTELSSQWQEADAEGGPWTTIPLPGGRQGSVEIGRPTLSTQPHAIFLRDYGGVTKFVRCLVTVVVGTLTRIIALATTGRLELVVASGVASGGGGGGGEVFTWTATHNADGYNFTLDQDKDTFWKGERDGLADDWVQLLANNEIMLNISNRVGNEWVRIGKNLEPNSNQTFGSAGQRWDQAYIDEFVDFDGASGVTPGTGDGRIYWNNVTKHFNQIDDAGTILDLAASGAGVTDWANFTAINDVRPDTAISATARNLGSTIAGEQWGGLFMDQSTFIRWDNGGNFTELFIQATTGGFKFQAPLTGSHTFEINTTEQFKIAESEVTINPPILDFNDSAAKIQGLFELEFGTAGASLLAGASFGSFGSALVYDVSATSGHFFTTNARANIIAKLHTDTGDNIMELHPDTGVDASILKGVREIRFDGQVSPIITVNKAMITGNSVEAMFMNVADNQDYNLQVNGLTRGRLTGLALSLEGGVSSIGITPVAGNSLLISKVTTLPATFTCDDDYVFENVAGPSLIDIQGDFNTQALVPAQILLSGEDSGGQNQQYGSIKSRIDSNVVGLVRGDLELYGFVDGSDHEFITMKARDPLAPNDPVIYMRNNVEMLSNLSADRFIMNQARLEMSTVTSNFAPINNTDSVMYLFDAGSGVHQLKIRFDNGVTKVIADNQ